MNPLNYHHLRYFHAIAHCGNLTEAARLLKVSQSSISVQLKQLEESLSLALFDREHKALHLTEEGRIVLDYANTIFRTGEELLATIHNRGTRYRKILRVGSVATLSKNFQLEFLKDLISDDEVEVIIRSASMRELTAQLDSHQLDLILSNRPFPQDANSPFRSHLVDKQPVSILCPKRIRKRKRFNFPQDLSGAPLILPSPESDIRYGFDRIIEPSGIGLLIAAEADDMAMLRLLAREMDAYALLPPVVVKDELASGELVELHRIEELHESFYATTRIRRYPNPYLKQLLGTSKSK